MPNPVPANTDDSLNSSVENEPTFGEMLSQFEKSRSQAREAGGQQRMGTVIAVSADSVFLDIGFKSEGILPLADLHTAGQSLKPGDKIPISVKGRDPEGYYLLTGGKVERPTDWAALEKAFQDKSTIVGTVTGMIKGGLTVDVGVRAFMPASRSGVRETADLEKMVGQEIYCRIIKLDVAEEDVVVDHRAVAEEQDLLAKQCRLSELKEGDTVNGTVRSLTDYGAFVDLGGVDALLHVSDIAWSRIAKASDVLSVGQNIDVKILKLANEAGKQRISVGIKQLQPHPWDSVPGKYKLAERVRGRITRVAEFGAFVELEPGVEGLIHVSEMSWGKKLRSANTLVKTDEMVDAIILGINVEERRMSLGLKQALGDPWADAAKRYAAGTVVEGPVVSIMKFGAFVQLAEGVEGMIHISDFSNEKRINHPQEVVKVGQIVKAQVLSFDTEKRQIRLGIKQLAPSGLDEYLAEHKEKDVVSGRVLDVSDGFARVELGEGIEARCALSTGSLAQDKNGSATSLPSGSAKVDLSSLGSMLQARWRGTQAVESEQPQSLQAGQIRKFRIICLDAAAKKIELELV
jgi:small subunit ribosomal protein S1